MTKELLILYGARYAVVGMLNNGGNSFAKRLENGKWVIIEWDEVYNYLTEIIDKYKSESEVSDADSN